MSTCLWHYIATFKSKRLKTEQPVRAKMTLLAVEKKNPFIQVYIWLEQGCVRMEHPFLFIRVYN